MSWSMPTSPTPPFRLGEKTDDPLQMYLADIFTVSVNLVGLPGISVPCGLVDAPRSDGADRLPVGLQFVGKMFDEATILRVAEAFERTTDWSRQTPAALDDILPVRLVGILHYDERHMDSSNFPSGLAPQIAALGVAASAGRALEAQTVSDTTRFFPGFKSFKVKTSGAEINGVIGGQGPPVLLLHGAPQSHVSWRLVAPKLAATRTVVVPDLRGYGDSSKPPDGENHANYSKRAMALDQVEVMKHFGFEKFPVVGHDRGGRVDPPDGARSRRQGDARRRTRHRADALPLHALQDRVRPALLPLVQLSASVARPRERSQSADRGAEGACHQRDPARISEDLERPGEHSRHVRGLSRRRDDRHDARRSGHEEEDRAVPCSCCGARRVRCTTSTM